ncbi:hypothetical protein Tco_1017968 [Tanacetum coccineum]|uniref:Uncharacterized protein n=1 Tax=Tanacetum coccineum TaxID=301880 RepID=A0ABQ5FUF6_9ASTR
MSEFLKFLMARGVRIGRCMALRPNEVIVQNTTPPLPAAAKRPGHAGTSGHTKKRKTTPLTLAVSDSKTDGSSQDASESVHSVTPLNTFNPINANAEAGGSNQALQSDGHMEEEVTDASNNNDINNERVNSPHSVSFPSRSIPCIKSIHLTQRGTRRFALLMKRVRSSYLSRWISSNSSISPGAFCSFLGLDQCSILNDVEQCRNMMINLATPSVRASQNRLKQSSGSSSYPGNIIGRSQGFAIDCVGKEVTLSEKLAVVKKEKDDLLDKSKEQEELIKSLEEALASKTYSVSEAEKTADQLKGGLERLTVDLSQAEVVRHNYVRQLLPTIIQRLLSSDEYKKSLSETFNQAIAAGWT